MSRAIHARHLSLLGYLVLAAMGLRLLLSIGAPGFAAWSLDHAHLSLDGRAHPHVHAWERTSGPGTAEPSAPPLTQPAPASEVSATVVALPAVVVLLVLSGAFFLATSPGRPRYLGLRSLPATPPPRG